MNIIFVGNKEKGYFAEEVAKTIKANIDYIEENNHIKNHEDILLAVGSNDISFMIFDAEQYIDDFDIIADYIYKITEANNIKPIILVNTTNPKNFLVKACLDKNIRNFINNTANVSDKKTELHKNLTSYYDKFEREDIKAIEENTLSRNTENGYKTIGVVGSFRKTGTTTQCIQIAKFLKNMGYKVCIIEANNNKYFNLNIEDRSKQYISYFELIEAYENLDYEDKDIGLITFKNMDFFFNQDNLINILERKYDYLIYDYGTYSEQYFNKSAFLKDDYNIFIGGNSRSEIGYITNIFEDISYKNSKFILNFTDEESQKDTIELANIVSPKGVEREIFFTKYTPNPFKLSDKEMYLKLFNMDDTKNYKSNKKKKLSFLKIGGKNNE